VVERSAAGGAPEQIEMSTTLDKGKDKPWTRAPRFLAAAAAQLRVTRAPHAAPYPGLLTVQDHEAGAPTRELALETSPFA